MMAMMAFHGKDMAIYWKSYSDGTPFREEKRKARKWFPNRDRLWISYNYT